MTPLEANIRTLRALGWAMKKEAENAADRPTNAELLHLMGDAHLEAAEALEAVQPKIDETSTIEFNPRGKPTT